MAFGILLILLLLILSGAIAYIGDKLGRKIGKKRLSIFNLRPKHTSILITIVTGILITAFTLTVLLLVYSPARQVLFSYQTILERYKRQIGETEQELNLITADRDKVNAELETSRKDLEKTDKLLAQVQDNLTAAQDEVKAARAERDELKAQYDSLNQELSKAQQTIITYEARAEELNGQITALNEQIEELELGRDALIEDKKAVETQRDALVVERSKLESEIKSLSAKLEKRYEEFDELQQQILLGRIIFTADETVGVYSAPPQTTRAELEELFAQIIEDMRDLAGQRGAEPGESGDVLVYNEKRVEELIKGLQGRAKGAIIIAFSITNVTEGGLLVLGLRTLDDDLLFRRGEVLVEADIDGGQGKSEVEAVLQNMLVVARRLGLSRGIVPYAGTVGTASAEDILAITKTLIEKNGPVTVQLISAKDTYRLDQMQVAFKILE